MAAASLLALIDDIASLLDDVASMSKVAGMAKVAAKNTAGVLGDDLALNAQQVAGVNAERELPVVWAVAKGSTLNKLILVPAALLISALAAWAVLPLLMIGGAYLCFEGVEKLAHKWLHPAAEDAAHQAQLREAVQSSAAELLAFEQDKIKGAIRTDFVLSAEIIVIALGTVQAATLGERVAVLSIIAALMTMGVYGLVAAIVKLDDLGFWLLRRAGANPAFSLQRLLGQGILHFAPWLMKALSVFGTAAMFLVGGGIVVHGVPVLHHGVADLGQALAPLPLWFSGAVLNAVVGIVSGAVVLAVVLLGARLRRHFGT